MKNRWTGDEGTGYAHVQVIDVTTDRINSFKSACHSLIYDFNQDGYDVTVEIKDGEQFPNKLELSTSLQTGLILSNLHVTVLYMISIRTNIT
jgi:hypothetical protein